MNAPKKTDAWLSELLHNNASGTLLHILNDPDRFRYQLIYTQINRDKINIPSFQHHYLRVDKNQYFNPASTVKMPLAFLALEKLHTINKAAVNKYTPMLTHTAHLGQTAVLADNTAANGLPSVGHYIKKIFLVSDNDAYNRLYEFVGQKTINERLWQMGYPDLRITRRFTQATEEENRHTNPVGFVDAEGRPLYNQPAAYSDLAFDFSKKVLVGRAHYNHNDRLIQEPMDFTTHNNAPLEDLQQILQSVLFPASVSVKQRFDLAPDDYRFLYQCMSMLPAESIDPKYDTGKYFGSYAKFFLFRSGNTKIPPYIKVFNKTGWSYGFLTDIAYIVDFKNQVEFMLSGTIYVNRDGILNDDAYEYEELGYPFFKEVGNIIYQHELKRTRTFVPELKKG